MAGGLNFSAIIGVDLGQSADYTTTCGLLPPAPGGVVFDVPIYERLALGLKYPLIVEMVAKMARATAAKAKTALVVDRTGVGRPVVDMLRDALEEVDNLVVYAVSIKGDSKAKKDGRDYTVPKNDIIGSALVLFEANRIRIAKSMQHAAALQKELADYHGKIKKNTGYVSMGGRNEHDDLVLALCLACWLATRAKNVDASKMVSRVRSGLVSLEDLEAEHEEALLKLRPTRDVPDEVQERIDRDFERRKARIEREEIARVKPELDAKLRAMRIRAGFDPEDEE